MRPDPYKQKVSRRYQAARGIAPKGGARPDDKQETKPAPTPAPAAEPARTTASNKSYARRRIQDNSWRFQVDADSPDGAASGPPDGVDAAQEEEESIREFLRYLKDEAQSTATEHSAAYFQLRAEAESAVLDAPYEDTWGRLVEVDWNSLLDVAAAMPLHELLGIDGDTAPPAEPTCSPQPQSAMDGRLLARQEHVKPQQSTRAAGRRLDPAELAPGIGARDIGAAPSRQKQQPQAVAPPAGRPTTPTRAVDEMEAFLDQLL
ncbi:hypothetical protein LPJ61_002267 [Coemansia biformis]|uniref:Uncharacterized protein n=1 Tax=Coemansia biformis TaxID=1286918 RepID=A0A9W7YDE6_9FUNG|nr:hypothetical protein LPJ61_002267 [Coemansia biformis]